MMDKRNLLTVMLLIFLMLVLMLALPVSAKSPHTYFQLAEGEERTVPVGTQDYVFKVNRIFRRNAAVVLPDRTIENFRIFDTRNYRFKEDNMLTLKLLGVRRTRDGLVARFYAKNQELHDSERPRISHTIDHDATPSILEDSIETGEKKRYSNGPFEHELEFLYADTIYMLYRFDGRYRISTTGEKVRCGVSDDLIYFRPTLIKKLNNARHRIYFELFSPDFEVKEIDRWSGAP